MSDTRFILAGVVLIFVGFVVLGVFGEDYTRTTLEASEFGDCYEYFEDKDPIQIDCNVKLQDKTLFFAIVASLIGFGIISLIKGVRGKWDQNVKPEDMLGPGGEKTTGTDDNEDHDSGDTSPKKEK